MNVDEDLERLLRRQFRAEEPYVAGSPDLSARILADGHEALRGRHLRVGITAALGAAVVVAVTGVAASLLTGSDARPDPAVPPSASESTGKLSPALWAETLPRGAAPEVAFLAGTTVHLPSGAVTDLGVDDAGMVGQTVAGLIVLVEETDDRGAFTSRYVLVHDDGSTFDMQTSARTAGAAQEALVSPDGRYFTNGDQVVDKSTGLPITEMPEEAQVLISWTPEGIIYSARGQRYVLWSLDGGRTPLDGYPGVYSNGTDVGMRSTGDGSCPEVVRIDSAGEVTQLGHGCLPGLLSVSPDGAVGLTTDLQVVDIETGEKNPLSDTPLGDIDNFVHVHWLSDHQLLVPVPAPSRDVDVADGFARVLRCDTARLTCESATGSINSGDYRGVQLP